MLPAGDQDEVEPEDGRNYRPKHVKVIEIINKTIIVASSWLFILLYFTYLAKHSKLHEIFKRSQHCLLDSTSTLTSNAAKIFNALSNISLGSQSRWQKCRFHFESSHVMLLCFIVGN